MGACQSHKLSYLVRFRTLPYISLSSSGRTSLFHSENLGSIPCWRVGHGLSGKASSLGLEDYRFESGCPEADVAQW